MLRRLLVPVWNPSERRIRAPWRILLFGVAVVAAFAALGLVVDRLPPGVVAAVVGWLPPGVRAAAVVRGAAGAVAAAVLVLVLVTLAGVAVDRRPLRGYGVDVDRDWWLDFGFGLALGAVLMTLVFAVDLAAGWATVVGTFRAAGPLAFPAALLAAVVLFLAVAVGEELLVRGYVLTNLAEGLRFLGPRPAVALATLGSSALFGLLHASNPNATVVSTLAVGLAGVLLALGYVLTGDLAIPIGLHVTWNFFQGPVYGYPVSGLDVGVSALVLVRTGPQAVTGGPFGPEAGLTGVGAMVLGALAIVGYVHRRYGELSLAPLAAPALNRWRWAGTVDVEE